MSATGYPKTAVDEAIVALEAARPDTKAGGAVREQVEAALSHLYRARELHDATATDDDDGSER